MAFCCAEERTLLKGCCVGGDTAIEAIGGVVEATGSVVVATGGGAEATVVRREGVEGSWFRKKSGKVLQWVSNRSNLLARSRNPRSLFLLDPVGKDLHRCGPY